MAGNFTTPWYDSGIIDVSADAVYPGTPQVDMGNYLPSQVMLVLQGDSTAHVEYSLDGTNTIGTLKTDTLTAVARNFGRGQKYPKIWFKTIAGTTVNVLVQADGAFR
tara:strand:+ start:3652 stop:3972 length:321 start_codon:yes stop_codon:yes gene_type:complete